MEKTFAGHPVPTRNSCGSSNRAYLRFFTKEVAGTGVTSTTVSGWDWVSPCLGMEAHQTVHQVLWSLREGSTDDILVTHEVDRVAVTALWISTVFPA